MNRKNWGFQIWNEFEIGKNPVYLYLSNSSKHQNIRGGVGMGIMNANNKRLCSNPTFKFPFVFKLSLHLSNTIICFRDQIMLWKIPFASLLKTWGNSCLNVPWHVTLLPTLGRESPSFAWTPWCLYRTTSSDMTGNCQGII